MNSLYVMLSIVLVSFVLQPMYMIEFGNGHRYTFLDMFMF